MSTRSIILDEIRIVAAEQNKSLPPLTDDLGLLDSGLELALFGDPGVSSRGLDGQRPIPVGH